MLRKRGRQPRFSDQSYLRPGHRPAVNLTAATLVVLLAPPAGGPGLALVVAVPGRSSVSDNPVLT